MLFGCESSYMQKMIYFKTYNFKFNQLSKIVKVGNGENLHVNWRSRRIWNMQCDKLSSNNGQIKDNKLLTKAKCKKIEFSSVTNLS